MRRGADEDAVTLTPLYADVAAPRGATVVFVASLRDGDAAYWGVAVEAEGGPEFVVDRPLAADTRALVAVVPGDETSRLLVTAAPAASTILYAPPGGSYRALDSVADGVGSAALDDPRGRVRVLGADDEPIEEQALP